MYKPGPDLYMADWLSRNYHVEGRDQEITGMKINVSAIRHSSKNACMHIHRGNTGSNT